MICANCGNENESSAKFCAECGNQLRQAGCPSCGAPNKAGAKFCNECGTQLVTGATAPLAGLGSAAGPVSPASPVAERRLVSILFADLVGFTPFSEERDPETVRDLLTRYFDAARLAVERHGGTVEKFIGDAVMAVWGTPTAHEDDAERAVRAALEIVDASRGLAPGIEARAGVLTGETAVTIGAVGQGMVAGDLVNTAARLQSVAPPGTVLVGEATMRTASAAIAFEPLGQQDLKGKSSPVPSWRALRVVAQRGGQGRTEALEPPFVGREEELRLLKDAIHATGREQRVRLISITGPAGVGKSRLAWELEKYLDGVVETVYWHRGRSPSYGEGIAFWALGEMVRRRAGLRETDDEATTRERLAATVLQYVPGAEDRLWVEPALLALLGLEPAPAGGRDALFAGWRIFFENVAQLGTVVLLFEDLQWGDSGLLDFIDHLLDWSKGAPILIITLARPELFEHHAEWGAGKRHFTALALEPLTLEAMHELLSGLVPGLPDPAVQMILARADGIPLYAVETVRMLVAEGRLERSDGTYRPVGDLGRLSVPDTLRSLIASRLDAIDPTDRALLQDASVLGRTFTPTALAAITGKPEHDLEERLRSLVRRELLELVADPRSPERGQYGFIQSLIREVAYETLAKRDRRTRHLAAARYFEALGEDELAGVLASHYVAAYEASSEGPEADALATQARLALRGAAERAAGLGGHEQAVSYLEQALGVTTDPHERADLLERAAISADTAARYEAAVGYARRAVEAYRAAGDPGAAGRATGLLGRTLIDAGQLPEAVDELEAALGSLTASEPSADAEAVLLTNLSRALMRSNAPQRALEVADRALALAERLDLEEMVAEAFNNRGSVLQHLGQRRGGVAMLEAALRLAESGGWIAAVLRARHNLAFSVAYDDPRRAREILQGGLELALRVGNRYMAVWLTALASWISYLAGEGWDWALAAVRDIAAWATSFDDRARMLGHAALILAARGELSADLTSDFDAAAAHVADPQILIDLGVVRGEVAFSAGEPTKAYQEAIRVADLWPDLASNALRLAVRAAIWEASAERCRDAAVRLDALPYGGDVRAAYRPWEWAAVAALEGHREEGVAGFREALRRLRELGLDFEVARTALDMTLLLGPAEPEVEPAAEEARSIFQRLGAKPYLDRLEAAMARPAYVAATAAAPATDQRV